MSTEKPPRKRAARSKVIREIFGTCGRFNVRGIPNFAVFADGRLVMEQAGVVNHDQRTSG
jgi:hypothetical protein